MINHIQILSCFCIKYKFYQTLKWLHLIVPSDCLKLINEKVNTLKKAENQKEVLFGHGVYEREFFFLRPPNPQWNNSTRALCFGAAFRPLALETLYFKNEKRLSKVNNLIYYWVCDLPPSNTYLCVLKRLEYLYTFFLLIFFFCSQMVNIDIKR